MCMRNLVSSNFIPYLAMLLAFLFSDSSLVMADTLWDYDGSRVRVIEKQGELTIIYEAPLSSEKEAGISPGTILFKGLKDGNRIVGSGFYYSKACSQPQAYSLDGELSSGNRLNLRGIRFVQSDCHPTASTIPERLAFRKLGDVDPITENQIAVPKTLSQTNSKSGGDQTTINSQSDGPRRAASQKNERVSGSQIIEETRRQATAKQALQSPIQQELPLPLPHENNRGDIARNQLPIPNRGNDFYVQVDRNPGQTKLHVTTPEEMRQSFLASPNAKAWAEEDRQREIYNQEHPKNKIAEFLLNIFGLMIISSPFWGGYLYYMYTRLICPSCSKASHSHKQVGSVIINRQHKYAHESVSRNVHDINGNEKSVYSHTNTIPYYELTKNITMECVDCGHSWSFLRVEAE